MSTYSCTFKDCIWYDFGIFFRPKHLLVFGAQRMSRNDLSSPCRLSLGGKKGPAKPLISISGVQQEIWTFLNISGPIF